MLEKKTEKFWQCLGLKFCNVQRVTERNKQTLLVSGVKILERKVLEKKSSKYCWYLGLKYWKGRC